MKLAAALSLLQDILEAVPPAVIPTVWAIIQSPSLIRPSALSRLFFANLWVPLGNGVNENNRAVKESLIIPNAYGVVLDIGAGYGFFATVTFLLLI